MKQIKFMSAQYLLDLENRVNEFIAVSLDKDIIDIKINALTKDDYVAMIVYDQAEGFAGQTRDDY